MLPASDLSEILANLTALQLEPNTTAQILAAVLAPLLRSSGPDVDPDLQLRPRGRPRRRISRRRKKATRRAARSTDARSRAIAALRDNPNTSLTDIAKIAKVSRSTVVNARDDLAAEGRRKPRETMPSTPIGGAKTDRRARAQQFLKDALAGGPKPVTTVEEVAAKAHVDEQTLGQARADLGVVTSRGNAGGVQAVQWSLPG